jgi:putative peptidoglycan lipid II flippase
MDRQRIASAGAVIMVGTLTTSVLGFVRAFVIARSFGAGPQTNAFFAALVVPQMFYDQLIGGAIAAVLIPTFSRLAEEDEAELWRVVGSIFALVLVVLGVAVLLLELAAYPLMTAIISGFVHKKGVVPLSVHLVRLLLPALVFMGLSGVAIATLYSLQQRAVAAFAPSWYHLGIITATLVATNRWGIAALPVGAVAGAALQFGVQLPSILRAHARSGARSLRIRVDLRHPMVRRILRLYLPVAAGIVVSIVGQVIDFNFKSHLPQTDGLSVMQYATQIIQFPVGIIALALGMAVLPAISTDAAAARLQGFKETLDLGFRLVLVLMVPAMVGLLVLATPIITLLFQRGQFHHLASVHTATALLGYAPQLPFVGIDQLLIFAFYARHDTLTPAVVGVMGVGIYVAAAALLIGPLTILGLALANTIQIGSHAAILLVLLLRAMGPLPVRKLLVTGAKVALASAIMALAIFGVERWFSPDDIGRFSRLAAVCVPMLAAFAVYVSLMALLRVEEAGLAWGIVRSRVTGGRTAL